MDSPQRYSQMVQGTGMHSATGMLPGCPPACSIMGSTAEAKLIDQV